MKRFAIFELAEEQEAAVKDTAPTVTSVLCFWPAATSRHRSKETPLCLDWVILDIRLDMDAIRVWTQTRPFDRQTCVRPSHTLFPYSRKQGAAPASVSHR